MLSTCGAARSYDQKHRTILRTYSEMTLETALDEASALIRAVALRRMPNRASAMMKNSSIATIRSPGSRMML